MGRVQRPSGRKLLAVALASIIGAVIALAVPATPAFACGTVGCNGVDPVAQGCSVSSTPGQVFIGGSGGPPSYTLQLRYSFGCQTFWGRGMKDCLPSGGNPLAYVRVQRQLNTPYGYYTANVYYSPQVPCGGSAAPVWTPMVTNYGNDRARSCMAAGYFTGHPSSFPESYWSWCTRWVYDDVWTTG
jgi:hypothetical protein